MYSVSKTFSFCYGHRLLNDPGKCSRIHGHSAKVTIMLESAELDGVGMVCHFNVLKERVGAWIENTLDHRMILCRDDAMAKLLKDADEDFVEVDFNPTAENLAKFVFDRAKGEGLPVARVEFWESPTSKATFTPKRLP